MEAILDFLTRAWAWFKKLPILGPILRLFYSRKAVISAAIVAFVLKYLPGLAPAQDELSVVIAQIVVIVFVAVANILGIALEDAAAKRAAVTLVNTEQYNE